MTLKTISYLHGKNYLPSNQANGKSVQNRKKKMKFEIKHLQENAKE